MNVYSVNQDGLVVPGIRFKIVQNLLAVDLFELIADNPPGVSNDLGVLLSSDHIADMQFESLDTGRIFRLTRYTQGLIAFFNQDCPMGLEKCTGNHEEGFSLLRRVQCCSMRKKFNTLFACDPNRGFFCMHGRVQFDAEGCLCYDHQRKRLLT